MVDCQLLRLYAGRFADMRGFVIGTAKAGGNIDDELGRIPATRTAIPENSRKCST